MSDELEPKDDLLIEDDEELMSDFKDLFGEDEESGESANEGSAEGETGEAADEANQDLDELDAFLDDFEKNLDVSDDTSEKSAETEAEITAEAAPEESTEGEAEIAAEAIPDEDSEGGDESASDTAVQEEAEAVPSPALDLDEDELNLDVAGEELLDTLEEEPEESPAQEDEAVDDESADQEVEATVATAATAAAAVAATTNAASATPPVVHTVAAPINKSLVVASVAMLTTSILLSIGALWIGLGLGTQVEVLNENVSELQRRVLSISRRGVIAPQAEVSDQVSRLAERVNELAVIVEGPVGHMREINQQALQRLDSRMDDIEMAMGKGGKPVENAKAEVRTTTTVKRDEKPLVKKITTIQKQNAPQKANKTGWAINLLTVASANTAREELARLRKMGVRVDKQSVKKDGKTLYRLRVTGFDSYEGAKAYIDTVEKQTGFSSAWVAKE